MPKSTNLIGDITTVRTNGPAAQTQLNATNPVGFELTDYIAGTDNVGKRFKEALVLLGGASQDMIKYDTDSTDSANLALINGVIAILNGGGSPSVQALTDTQLVITNGPNAATQLKATGGPTASSGVIMDYIGNCNLVLLKLKEAKVILTALNTLTDAGTDAANKTLIANLLLSLV